MISDSIQPSVSDARVEVSIIIQPKHTGKFPKGREERKKCSRQRDLWPES